MAAIYVLLLWSVVLSCNVIHGRVFAAAAQDEFEDAADWLDPTDMINYDLATRKMRNSVVCPDSFFAIIFACCTLHYYDIQFPFGVLSEMCFHKISAQNLLVLLCLVYFVIFLFLVRCHPLLLLC